ncbi:hypothetical protein F5I97DRAFT_1929279 [Phlebopus sp. FC_14]|nr:hypothetical protein F5I97DRAFT_1929279 [Phlebopus sp. FC_14]
MAGDDDDDWLVADSEDDDGFLPAGDDLGESSVMLNKSKLTEPPAIQSATFCHSHSPRRERPRLSPDVSGESLFTPPPGPHKDPHTGASSPRVTEGVVPPKPKARPRPRVRMKTADAPRPANEESAQSSGVGVASASPHISDPSTLSKSTEDSIQPGTATSSSFSEIVDPYSSLGIAERAKMRSRKPQTGRRPTYRPADDDIIELTSDDELALKPTKRQKKPNKSSLDARPQPKPRPKSRQKKTIQSNSAPGIPEAPVGSASSILPASTTATIPPSTPLIPPEASPLSSPAIIVRKRKRTRPCISDDDKDDMDVDGNVPREPSPSISGPTPFFASSSSVPVSDSGVEMPPVGRKSSSDQIKLHNTTQRGGQVKAQDKRRKGRREQQINDEVVDELPGPDPLVTESTSVAGEEASGVNRASRSRKTATVEVSIRRKGGKGKGKGKGKAVVLDGEEEELALPSTAAVPQPQVREDESVTSPPILDGEKLPQGSASKENMQPDDPSPTKHGPLSNTPIAIVHSRALSIKPKATPMSELIRRVNSQPSSPFPSVSRSYSPWLKSSRTMLSKIAPLHPNRRSPPPPLPRPPPPKKSKKQIEMEERIEEELAETIEGWSCMTDEERRDLRRARIDAELGYE